jgi:hypothetical protein
MSIKVYLNPSDEAIRREEVTIKCGRYLIRRPATLTLPAFAASWQWVNPNRRLVWNVAERRPELR